MSPKVTRKIATPKTGRPFNPAAKSAPRHPTNDEIARLAYQRYEQRGRVDGSDLDDWLSAEAALQRPGATKR